jgi:arginyl-tRNA synthetase
VTPTSLSALIVVALRAAAAKGEIGELGADQIPAEVSIDRSKNREHGDYSTNIALVLAKPAGLAPRRIAELLVSALSSAADIAKIEAAGPGFLNITLAASAAGAICITILSQESVYGSGDLMAGAKVNLEFISANPTGPLHLGHTRWAAVGDALGRVLTAEGAEVSREFYINDRGVQLDLFGESIMAAANGLPTPTDGYHGAYITELAKEIVAAKPELLTLPDNVQMVAFREEGYASQLAHQQRVLDEFGTHFDVWFSERSLHQSTAVEVAFEKLLKQGHVYETDGATWLRTTDFGDDKDRVLRKSDNELTYFASDIAYYVDKRARGFDICIYLLGADHHGYVGRLKAAAACAGDNPAKNIEVMIGQLVKIIEGGQELKLSKRAGTIITLEDIVERVGVDAARYTLIRYPVDTPMTMDVDLLTKRTNENPVFYVQYAHARICGVLRNAMEVGVSAELTNFDPALLSHERESELLGALGEFPRVVATSAELREPHRVARYLEELAGTYHRFYDACRVLPLGDEEISPLHNARAVLSASTRQVLQNGLALLGVSAPERM